MKKKKILLSIIFILALFSKIHAQPCREVVGYYPGWQWYDRAKLVQPNSIDYSKYTIVNYAFFAPQTDGSIAGTDSYSDEILLLGEINWAQGGHYPNTSLVDLAHNANVKVLISVGGWSLSDNFSAIASDVTLRANFAHNCVILCDTFNLDGIDIDWEYPGFVGHNGTLADKVNFTLLLQQIRDSIDAYGSANGKTMLLTAAVAASESNMANIEWNNVQNILNIINLMSYDYFGAWDATTNHNAPLYAPAQGDVTFNLDSSVQYLMQYYNVPASKITCGVAFYGRSVQTTAAPALFVASTGIADNGTFPEDAGSPLYYNVMKNYNLFTRAWDLQAQVPYLTGNGNLNTFVSYDDEQSIALKAQYIVDNNLRGAIIWEITGDYLETSIGSGVIGGTPLADTLNKVFCNAPAGISSVKPNTTNSISVFPNPSSKEVTLKFSVSSNSSLKIVNVMGEVVYQEKFSSAERFVEQKIKIEVAGVYVAMLTCTGGSAEKKFVVQ